MKTIAAAAVLAATLATAAHAQSGSGTSYSDSYSSSGKSYDDTSTSSSDMPSITIGGGVMVRPDYSGADTYKTSVLPALVVQKEITPGNTAYFKGLTAGLDHVVNTQLTVGAMADYRFGRDSSDSNRLSGMDDIDGAIEIGPKVRYQLTPQIGLVGTALFDISDAYNGYTARAGADYVLPLDKLTMLTVAGGLNYGSSNYNNTYYGVKSFQARPDRQAYSPGSGFTNFDASVGVRRLITKHWSVQGRLGADYLISDVSDSPLVEENFQPNLFLGVAYTF